MLPAMRLAQYTGKASGSVKEEIEKLPTYVPPGGPGTPVSKAEIRRNQEAAEALVEQRARIGELQINSSLSNSEKATAACKNVLESTFLSGSDSKGTQLITTSYSAAQPSQDRLYAQYSFVRIEAAAPQSLTHAKRLGGTEFQQLVRVIVDAYHEKAPGKNWGQWRDYAGPNGSVMDCHFTVENGSIKFRADVAGGLDSAGMFVKPMAVP